MPVQYLARLNQIAPQHQRGPGGASLRVVARAAADLAKPGAGIEPARRLVVLVDFEEHGAQAEARRGGADAGRAGGAPSPRPRQARATATERISASSAARRDTMKPTVLRPLAARSAITLRSVSSCSNSCSLQPRLNEAACSAASAAASRGCADAERRLGAPNRRASKRLHRRGSRPASCGRASGRRR